MLFLWKQWGIWAIRWWLYWCKHNSHLPWVCRQLKIKITALPASTHTRCVRCKSWLRIRPTCSPLPQVDGFSGAAARDAWEVLMKIYQNSSTCCETVSLGKKNYLAKIRDVNFLYLTLAEKKIRIDDFEIKRSTKSITFWDGIVSSDLLESMFKPNQIWYFKMCLKESVWDNVSLHWNQQFASKGDVLMLLT